MSTMKGRKLIAVSRFDWLTLFAAALELEFPLEVVCVDEDGLLVLSALVKLLDTESDD